MNNKLLNFFLAVQVLDALLDRLQFSLAPEYYYLPLVCFGLGLSYITLGQKSFLEFTYIHALLV